MDILDCSTAAKSEEGVRMPLYVPGTKDVLSHKDKDDKKPREMFLVVKGAESPDMVRAFAKYNNRISRKKEGHVPSDEEIERDRVSDSKIFADVVIGGLVFMRKKWVEITPSNASEVLYQTVHFRNQVINFAANPEHFMKG